MLTSGFQLLMVVAELKCMQEEWGTAAELGKSAAVLHQKWVRDGRLPHPTSRHLSLRDLPKEFAWELLGPYRQSFKNNIVRKANRQIRETKAHLNQSQARGMLILVNNGNTTMDMSILNFMLGTVFKNGDFPEIDQVLYFTANMPHLTSVGAVEILGANKGRLRQTCPRPVACEIAAWLDGPHCHDNGPTDKSV